MRVSFLAPLLLLTACGAASPTWMPAGYTWHNDMYKAQPGPEAENLGYDYTPARNEYINTTWADVAKSLVSELEDRTGMTAQTLYVETLPESNAFNLSFDNALRGELRDRGYTLTDTPEGVVHLKYQAYKAGDEDKRYMGTTYNGEVPEQRKAFTPETPENFTFVLTLVKDGVVSGEVRRDRKIPAYGYVAGEGSYLPVPRGVEQSAAPAPVSAVKKESAQWN